MLLLHNTFKEFPLSGTVSLSTWSLLVQWTHLLVQIWSLIFNYQFHAVDLVDVCRGLGSLNRPFYLRHTDYNWHPGEATLEMIQSYTTSGSNIVDGIPTSLHWHRVRVWRQNWKLFFFMCLPTILVLSSSPEMKPNLFELVHLGGRSGARSCYRSLKLKRWYWAEGM